MSISPSPVGSPALRGRIIEAAVKVSVDAARPLPLACALYAIQSSTGVWLCAYYGMNRSVFDYLPQNGAEVDEVTLGIAFQVRQLVPTDQYSPAVWEEFKKTRFMGFE